MSERMDEFYVGYLPVPRRLRKFVVCAAAVLLVAAAAAAGLLAAMQRDPGDAVWDLDTLRHVEGTLYVHPYPLLRLDDGRTAILVDQGKIGAGPRSARFDGRRVRVSGYAMRRGECLLLELSADEDPMTPIDGPSVPRAPVESSTRVTLRGEIIDPKCFAGAMKPGDGKAHKACATLCIRGGIPPLFASGGQLYLLTDSAGDALAGASLEAIVPYVADAVEISGIVELRGDLKILRLARDSIRRL